MSIGVRVANRLQRREHPFDGDQVGDHLDRLGSRLVGVGPASDLIEIVADARDLAGALTLYFGRRGGPCPGARHGPSQQCRQRHPGGFGLGPPNGELGRRHADGDQGRAALTHGDASARGKRGPKPPAAKSA